ncbi:MAG: hypothetical protein CVV64_06105 [Candidatus Wallbacteria bacterium HGW-Wallbacteria-1]|jgi:F-type H+-transporting ATPase subunit delta|uniref:ATP synthase subunit delta n=1 Tax=Candidatus Wallbacteria bacterium HGW-Wallbacteria-1 TaxID=2013854 RepID=A0A2N1PSL9_9BACT|nr:MAG: hypothetical protein CVV64_06105 [Candidatus Wallbacteria bacterium HGW-Wallbacteria-1]
MADDKLALEFGKALAESVETSQLHDLHMDLKSFLKALDDSEEHCCEHPDEMDLNTILCHENVEVGIRRKILEDVLNVLKTGELLNGFLYVLLESNRFHILRDAAVIFEDRVYRAHGKVKVELVLSEEPVERVVGRIENIVAQVTGRKPEIEIRTDPSIIGGAVIRFEGTLMDLSVRGSLKRIRHAISR